MTRCLTTSSQETLRLRDEYEFLKPRSSYELAGPGAGQGRQQRAVPTANPNSAQKRLGTFKHAPCSEVSLEETPDALFYNFYPASQ